MKLIRCPYIPVPSSILSFLTIFIFHCWTTFLNWNSTSVYNNLYSFLPLIHRFRTLKHYFHVSTTDMSTVRPCLSIIIINKQPTIHFDSAIQEFVWATVCSDCYTIKMVTTHNNNIYCSSADSRTRVQQYKKSSLVWHLNLWTDRTLYQIQDRLQWPAVHLFFSSFFYSPLSLSLFVYVACFCKVS